MGEWNFVSVTAESKQKEPGISSRTRHSHFPFNGVADLSSCTFWRAFEAGFGCLTNTACQWHRVVPIAKEHRSFQNGIFATENAKNVRVQLSLDDLEWDVASDRDEVRHLGIHFFEISY